MPVDEVLVARVREALGRRRGLAEKRMFGGVAFLLGGNMCVGATRDVLIVRVGLEQYEDALAAPHAVEFDMTGKALRGWVMVEPPGIARDDDLRQWIARALDFVKTLPPK
ncbi:MAG: TfoX/Sxy family protein [Planctomycetales bacterium]|nr:TfoX/Sxy family protein [Planctomycetales bacterium]